MQRFQSLVRENPFCNAIFKSVSAADPCGFNRSFAKTPFATLLSVKGPVGFATGFNRSFAKTPFATSLSSFIDIPSLVGFNRSFAKTPFATSAFPLAEQAHFRVSIARSRKPLLQLL